MKAWALVLTCVWTSVAMAAPPAAPRISVQATDIRQLEFTWDSVPGVHRYELWFKSSSVTPWVKFQEQPAQRGPRFRIGVAVHLLDWRQARYYVKACNPSGCTNSNSVGVASEPLVAMGYIKPNNPVGHEFFGNVVALSADGKTLAVLTGENLGGRMRSAVLHVYRRTTSISGWRREARLLPSTVQANTAHIYMAYPLDISADGNVIALGLLRENVPGPNGVGGAGAVYLFKRTGTTWAIAQKITRSSTSADYFGRDVELDDAGRTLVVSHNFLTEQYAPGTLEVYRDPEDSSDLFVHQLTLPAPIENGESFCDGGVALSGDGQTLLRGCRYPSYVQVFNAPGFAESARIVTLPDALDTTYDGKVFIASVGLQTFAYRLGPTGWVVDGDLTEASGIDNASMRDLAISRDGKFVALGHAWDSSVGLGPIYPPYQQAATRSGAVKIFERKSSGWQLRRTVKPGSTHDQWFGHAVALGNNGKILAVGAPMDPSAATGIDGDRNDASMPERGAVWLY
jgi:trimeric autotransporter adhesin